MVDDDFDILLVDALYKEPSPATFGFKINLDSLEEQMSIELFRFGKADLHFFIQYVVDTDVYKCPNGTVANGMEAMLVFLRRLKYPNHLCDLSPLFGRAEPELSMTIHESVVCPNGLIANLFLPVAGRHHDAFMLHESNLIPRLQAKSAALPIFTLYGDPAYPLCQHSLGPYRGAQLTPDQQLFNERMSKVRESVEWSFGKVVQYFAFLDFKKNLKVLLQPVGKYYVVGSLLINCHTCLYGSVTSSYFGLQPPDLGTYLRN
ncbi:uncharacterized protein [Acropora muricata]